MVAPVLRPDLVLLFGQELQLLVRRLHVVVQAAQVVLAPLGVFLLREEHQREEKTRPTSSFRQEEAALCSQTNSG